MRKLLLAAVVALLVVLALAAVVLTPPGGGRSSASRSSASQSSTSQTSTASTPFPGRVSAILGMAGPEDSSSDWLRDNPVFAGSSLKIDYPPDYAVLVNFTLGLINSERGAAGLRPVALSTVPSGQQHADSMAYFDYFSHWDNQGYKPYMRYTLLGGTGDVEENLALSYCSSPSPNSTEGVAAACSVQTVENAINASEWGMLYNDTQCCGDGHRDNILQPFHDSVSLGIAYNSTTVFLVEDFENSFIGSESLQVSSGLVTLNGTLSQVPTPWMTRNAGAEIQVYYDPSPSSISPSELAISSSCRQYSELNESAACQYDGAYNPGTQVSTVLFPCPAEETCATGNYTYAQAWQFDSTSGRFGIAFSLSALEAAHGSGVYTIYLWPSARAPEPITSLSLFVTDT